MTISFDAASWAKAAGAFDDAAGGVRGFSASMSPGGGAGAARQGPPGT